MIRLGVNIDHIATLRQVRGASTAYPDLLYFVKEAVRAKAHQITIHLREDQRHIQVDDLKMLAKKCPVDLNLEMAVNDKMLSLALKHKPQWCCFVPENRRELTTEGGLNVVKYQDKIARFVKRLNRVRIKTSLFIEPDILQVQSSAFVGAAAVEFHTGKWVSLDGNKKASEWRRLCQAAELAHVLGLRVHAGHGLDTKHTRLIKKLPHLVEVNIGHYLVCDSLKKGLFESVKVLNKILKSKK